MSRSHFWLGRGFSSPQCVASVRAPFSRIPQSGTGLTPPGRTNPSQVFQFIFRGVAFAFDLGLHTTQALVFSPDTLAEIPEGANAIVLAPARVITRELPHPCVHEKITPFYILEYETMCPVFPFCFIFPSFSRIERYRVAVASDTCRNFSTSSLVILDFCRNKLITRSSFFRFRN